MRKRVRLRKDEVEILERKTGGINLKMYSVNKYVGKKMR